MVGDLNLGTVGNRKHTYFFLFGLRKIILNKFQFQPQSVLNLFLFFGSDFSLSVLIKFVLIKISVPHLC